MLVEKSNMVVVNKGFGTVNVYGVFYNITCKNLTNVKKYVTSKIKGGFGVTVQTNTHYYVFLPQSYNGTLVCENNGVVTL